MHKILTTLILVFSCLAFASNASEKVNLVCDGVAQNYADQIFDVEMNGTIVVIDLSKNIVNITGDFGGDYVMTKVTKDRIQFASESPSGATFVGGINRYTGKLIVHNELNESKKLLYHLKSNCRVQNKLF